jgi:Na+/melibiose symporter and related transporters
LLYKFDLTPPQGSQELIIFLSIPLFLTGTFSLVSLMTREAMVPDVIDAIHLESNIRQDATISSLTSFCAKCMTGFGQFFSGFILWLIAFPRAGNEPTLAQEEFLAFFQGPMIFILFLIPIFIFSYYSITRKQHREIKEGLENS